MIRGLRPALGCSYWGAVDREPTEVRLLWDERFLYIAFSCTDRDIVADPGLKRDGDVYEADACEFFLDVSGEGKEWFELQVSPLNQVMDTVSSFTGGPGDQAGAAGNGLPHDPRVERRRLAERGGKTGVRRPCDRLDRGICVSGGGGEPDGLEAGRIADELRALQSRFHHGRRGKAVFLLESGSTRLSPHFPGGNGPRIPEGTAACPVGKRREKNLSSPPFFCLFTRLFRSRGFRRERPAGWCRPF